jgi:hypothetical protein
VFKDWACVSHSLAYFLCNLSMLGSSHSQVHHVASSQLSATDWIKPHWAAPSVASSPRCLDVFVATLQQNKVMQAGSSLHGVSFLNCSYMERHLSCRLNASAKRRQRFLKRSLTVAAERHNVNLRMIPHSSSSRILLCRRLLTGHSRNYCHCKQ